MSSVNTMGLQSWWAQRAPREQTILKFAALLVSLALLWWVALAPGIRTLRTFEATQAAQAAQLQAMQQMQAQAQVLLAQPKLPQTQAVQALQASVQQAFGAKADFTSSAAHARARTCAHARTGQFGRALRAMAVLSFAAVAGGSFPPPEGEHEPSKGTPGFEPGTC